MKKVLLFTLYGNWNYGNKLQNYATQELLKKYDYETNTVVLEQKRIVKVKNFIKKIIQKSNSDNNLEKRKLMNFENFDKLIYKVSTKKININEYDYIIIGSDQIWNPTDEQARKIIEYVIQIKDKQIISISSSIAIDKIPDEYVEIYKQHFNNVKKISVREEKGKEIIETLTNRNDIEVLLDPTMLIDIENWNKVSKKPKMLDTDNFILCYFLGDLSGERKKEIERIAKENNYKIVTLLDKNSKYYECGPAEFIWLESHAKLVCTDSFHSSVFAMMYKVPFIVFDREGKRKGMNSRIENLLRKFKLEDRCFKEKITKDLLECQYESVNEILDNEKEKANNFIKEAIK